jgi:(p)ppGpp synthase/HD superfamily hydrolase
MTTTRCRAKDKDTCAQHGFKRSLGIGAQARITGHLRDGKRYHISKTQLRALPLKELNAEGLAVAVSDFGKRTAAIDPAKLDEAILFAADAHRRHFRANRGKFPYTPYIEHPLRNAMRVIRYGTADQAVLNACLLHDTVEDAPFEIAKNYAGITTKDEAVARQASLDYIARAFGQETADIVLGLSNPLDEGQGELTEAQKRDVYAHHVRDAIQDPKVALCKISDLIDNAASLHHTLTGMKPEAIQRRARKYLEIWPDIEARIAQERIERRFPIPEDGLRQIEEHLALGRTRLEKFATTDIATW